MGDVEKDGPEVAHMATQAAEKIREVMLGGATVGQAEEAAELWLVRQHIPYHLVEVAVAEAMNMMPWTWK